MEDSVYNSRPTAVLGIPSRPVHVPESIMVINSTLDAIKNSGDHLVDADVMLEQEAHSATLQKKQEDISVGGSTKVDLRNIAYDVCFADHKDNMLTVQKASNKIADFNEAAVFIKRNGYALKKELGSLLNESISIKRKENTVGVIIAEVKAPDTTRSFSIDWEYSYDNGTTWHHTNSTAICKREIGGLEELKKVIVRARFIIGEDDPTDWMISNSVNL
jgi:hypothetical protein